MAPVRTDGPKNKGAARTSTPPTLTNKIVKPANASKPKPQPLNSSKSSSNTKLKRRPGRPFKMAPRAGASAKAQRAQSAPSTSADSPNPVRYLSIIETLPVEIIEKIFLYSPNLNFPRASPVLAAALSSERIYRLLILLAFWKDHSKSPVSPAIQRILAPVDYNHVGPLDEETRREMQRAIFSFRWCTMDRLLQQVPTLITMTLHRIWLDAGIEMEPSDLAALQKFMNREDGSALELKGKADLHDYYTKLGLISSKYMDLYIPYIFLLRISPMTHVEIILRPTNSSSPLRKAIFSSPALNLLMIPDYLLRGHATGFTADNVAFLEMLRMTSKSFHDPDCLEEPPEMKTFNRNLLHAGVTKAIETKNYNAMISLLKHDQYQYTPLINSSRNSHPYPLTPRPYSIPPEHFIQVTRVGRENPSLNLAFFEALLRTSAESMPADSPEIMQWAIDGEELSRREPTPFNILIGNFARWLSDFMIRLPRELRESRGLEYEVKAAPLFVCGALNLDHMVGCVFAEEVLAPGREPLGNWTMESTFRLDGLWVQRDGSTSR